MFLNSLFQKRELNFMEELQAFFRKTIEDKKLSNAEKKALLKVFLNFNKNTLIYTLIYLFIK